MKLSAGEATALAKQGCKHCYGRGYLHIQNKYKQDKYELCKCVIKTYQKLKRA